MRGWLPIDLDAPRPHSIVRRRRIILCKNRRAFRNGGKKASGRRFAVEQLRNRSGLGGQLPKMEWGALHDCGSRLTDPSGITDGKGVCEERLMVWMGPSMQGLKIETWGTRPRVSSRRPCACIARSIPPQPRWSADWSRRGSETGRTGCSVSDSRAGSVDSM